MESGDSILNVFGMWRTVTSEATEKNEFLG